VSWNGRGWTSWATVCRQQALPRQGQSFHELSPLQTVEQLQAFLGLFNFYRKFGPAAARILRPLTDALVGGTRGSAQLTWTVAMEASFTEARTILANTALLDHPAAEAEILLLTNASASHVGGVM
jgi:hypothetical protein